MAISPAWNCTCSCPSTALARNAGVRNGWCSITSTTRNQTARVSPPMIPAMMPRFRVLLGWFIVYLPTEEKQGRRCCAIVSGAGGFSRLLLAPLETTLLKQIPRYTDSKRYRRCGEQHAANEHSEHELVHAGVNHIGVQHCDHHSALSTTMKASSRGR